MAMRSHAFGLGLVVLAVAGCGDPPPTVRMTPPGIEVSRTPALPEDQAPQALGESVYRVLEAEAEAKSQGQGEATTEGAQGESAPTPAAVGLAEPTEPGDAKVTPSGLSYETITPGTGPVAQPGQTVAVHYTGTLQDGTQFDSSRGQSPLRFRIGAREVIRGWDEGVAGMRVGERRKLTIPPDLAYGAKGTPDGVIPPNATLTFDVELVEVR